ncbi:endonuclease III [Lactobacillus helveticus]|uniref:Endonuclease III n=1 Tax=Lactobacillus helveticus CIRM-BIA 104 TaxID=1226333 RepID=U6FBN2_LACHE|nr:endonuclease III [Lactobacillus helveticus]AZA21640.1 MAG: endonuclease III [Lactobacillus helveticus]EEW68992.1 putative endonuclease III [Lactobacillus helveticus DSM 20075 = CGMCC 1.1877]KGL03882.1 endonuclease III [Lactobacillus helveticus]KGL05546.1 endonuclease III [Lactobacillus helveticus]KRL39801.1 endonuclease III [Lactobacillus helveticus DSM 20075 = CGMCC 1.1877]
MVEDLLSDDEARTVLKRILAMYPNAKGELHWDNTFHLLCAVMMSAQTTDKMVNRVMPDFIKKFPTPEVLANASIEEIESTIKTIGLYRSKAKHLKATAKILVEKYDSKIPEDKKTLMTFPGVGEKTASVVLAEGYGVPAIAVDTHISRISKAFHIVNQKAAPHEVEQRLESILPKNEWIKTHHAMILFGRYIMPARAKGDPYSYLN